MLKRDVYFIYTFDLCRLTIRPLHPPHQNKSIGEEKFISLLSGYYDTYTNAGGNFDALVIYYRKHLDDDSAGLVDEWLVGTSYVAKLNLN